MRWKSLAIQALRLTPSLSRSYFPSSFTSLSMSTVAAPGVKEGNPFLKEWTTPFEVPPFKQIEPSHFEPAFEVARADHIEEVKEIANSNEPATFENTIVKMDACGGLLFRIQKVFYNLCASCSSTDLQAVQRTLSPILAAHMNNIYTMPGLFARIDEVFSERHSLDLTPEQLRLVERFHLDFTRAGAKFSENDKKRYAEIVKELATLTTQFQQNIIEDESELNIVIGQNDLTGLPDSLIKTARQAAIDRGYTDDGKYVITLSRSLVVPFLTCSDRRDLREKAWRMWTMRGELDSNRDNLAIAKQILILRAEQAKMHGYKSFADYATADTMAGNPNAVKELLEMVWGPAKESADKERSALQEFIKEEQGQEGALDEREFQSKIQPWDWRYYAEKVRSAKYNLDASEVKPYFPLTNMCNAIFDCAYQLFGLKFVKREDIEAYHPDVDVYEVREEVDGKEKLVAIFLHDNFARPMKNGGAWMSDYRGQTKNPSSLKLDGFKERVTMKPGDFSVPIIVNNNNFAKGADGEPTLLSFDDARTLFHEFGHGLHGMLSNVNYRRISGTSVLKDFVELPSQLYEHWLSEPTVLRKHARHYLTDEVIPDELLEKLFAARNFNLGFDTIEYTVCALVDQALHQIPADELEGLDISEFEKSELQRLGMPDGIVMRHRPAHFAHLFASSSYASGYYVYLWAEVLDADGFDAFKETNDCFNKDVASKVRKYIYSSGNSLDPREAFKLFRGREAIVQPMLKKKGLLV